MAGLLLVVLLLVCVVLVFLRMQEEEEEDGEDGDSKVCVNLIRERERPLEWVKHEAKGRLAVLPTNIASHENRIPKKKKGRQMDGLSK